MRALQWISYMRWSEQPVFSLRMTHRSGLALKILYKQFKHPNNVEMSLHDSAAWTPTILCMYVRHRLICSKWVYFPYFNLDPFNFSWHIWAIVEALASAICNVSVVPLTSSISSPLFHGQSCHWIVQTARNIQLHPIAHSPSEQSISAELHCVPYWETSRVASRFNDYIDSGLR